MNLRREPQRAKHGSWLALIATAIAAIAGVQLISGTGTWLWLLLACAALWALLIQASQADDTRIRVRTTPHRRPGSTPRS